MSFFRKYIFTSWKRIIDAVFFAGWGITLHAVASELIKKGGISEVLALQGEYIGLVVVLIAYVIVRWKE